MSLFGLIVFMVFGVFLLQRMWTVQSDLRHAQSNSAHLDRLYDEALDEVADWRNKYDADIKKADESLQEKTKNIETLELEAKSLREALRILQEEHKQMDDLRKTNEVLLQAKEKLENNLSEIKGQLMIERGKCAMLASHKIKGDGAARRLHLSQ